MISLKVISKRGGGANQVSESEIVLKEASVIRLGLSREQIKGVRRVGNDLVITAVSGEVITVREFFVSFEGNRNDLVLADDEKGGLWLAEFGAGQGDMAVSYSGIDSIEPLLMQQDFNFGVLPWLVGGGLAAAGLAGGGGGGGGGGGSTAMSLVQLASPDDSSPPGRPTVNPSNARSITGTAEPGTTVRVTDNTGKEIGSATVAPDGSYVVVPATPPSHGTEIRVVAVDQAGNVSPEARTTVDSMPPGVPKIDPTAGIFITGTAEPGSVVAATDESGNVIGSATAGQDGVYRIAPAAPLADRTVINVVAVDSVGNASTPATTAVDSTAPARPTVNPTNGSLVTGTAEPGALVTVKDSTGKVIGSATAGTSGEYSVAPATPPADGATISVVATDPAGNASQPATATIDRIPPAAPKVDPTNGNAVTGTAEPGSVVTVVDDKGAAVGRATANSGGAYSLVPKTPLADGTVLRVAATDAAGNTGPETRTTVDGGPPSAPVVDPSAGRSISGSAEPGSLVTVSDGAGKRIGSATADAGGKFSIVPDAPLADGTQVSVVATDSAGNASQPARATIDGAAPAAPVINPTDGRSIAGTAEAGSVVTVRDDSGKLIGSTTADSGGKFSIAVATPAANGTVITAVATDPAGNASAPGTATIDSSPPAMPVIHATNGSLITGSAELGSIVTVRDGAGNLVGSAAADTGGRYSIRPTTVPSHDTVLRAVATDAAGNTGPEARTTVDSELPAVPKVDPTAGASITGTTEPGALVTIKDGAGNLIGSTTADAGGKFEIKPATPAAHDTQLSVTATDAAGNTSQPARTTVDSRAPDAPTVKPTNGSTISGKAEAGAVVTVKDDSGKLIGSATADTGGAYVIKPATAPQNGTVLRVTATDAAGNTSPGATATVDSVPPPEPSIDPSNGKLISGTAESDSVITLRDGAGNLIGSTTAAANGAYSIKPNAVLADGTVLRAFATDAAGNAGPEARSTVDGVVPDAPTVSPTNGSRIVGKAEAGSIVTVKDDAGNLVGSTAAESNGTYSITPATPPAHGTVLHVTATDAAGNTSPEARATVDRTALLPPTVNPTDGSPITGTAEAGSVVTVKDDAGKLIGSATADSRGDYSIVPAATPSHGTVLHVVATNAAGNESPEATATVDSVPPPAPTIAPSNGNLVTGTAEAGAVVRITDESDKLIGSAIAAPNGAYSIKPATVPAHGTVLRAVATDAAGNVSPEARTQVDRVLPSAPKVDPTQGGLVTGTAEAGSVVAVRDDAGNLIGSTTADGSGAYSIKPAATLPNGTVLRVTATDAAGNASPETTAAVDSAPPAAPAVNPTNGSVITGTAEVGSLVTVRDGTGSSLGSATADAGGNYTIRPATAPAHDAVLKLTATDAAGNTSPSATATVDSKAPDAPTVKPTSGNTIAGTAEAGALVTVRDDAGNLIGSVTAGGNGAYSITPTVPAVNGTRLRVVATDAAGNTSQPATATVDSVAPAIAVAVLNDANNDGFISAREKGSDVTVRVTLVSGAAEGDTISISDGTHDADVSLTPADVARGFVDVSFPNPAEGASISVSATSRDLAGNASKPSVTDSAVLDTTAPATPATVSAMDNFGPVQGAIVNGGSTDDSTPVLAGSGAVPGEIVKVYDGSTLVGSTAVQANGSWEFTPTGLGQGSHSITHTITDAAGNTSAASAPLVFAVDIAAVAVTVTKAGETAHQLKTRPAGFTDDTTPAVEGTASAGAVVTIKEGSAVLASATADAGGNWSLVLPTQAEGAHSYKATAVNAAGNSSETTFTLTIDTTPPAVPAIAEVADDVGALQGALSSAAATDDARPTLSGSGATPGDIVTIHDNGSAIGSTTVQSDGRWSFTTAYPTAALSEGEHKLTVTATDPVGNQSGHSAPFVVTVDTTPPARPAAVSGYADNTGAVQDQASAASFTDDTTPGFRIASAAAGLTPTLYIDGVKVAATYDPNAGTLTPTFPLGEGEHSISYTLTDAAGNESPRANDFRLTVDTTPPSALDASRIRVLDDVGPVQGTLAADAKTDDSKPEYTGTADAAQVSAINVYDNGTLIGSTAVNADGTWRFTPALPLALGAHSLVARPVDAAGNIGAATPASTFTLVGDPPAAPAIIGVIDDRGSVIGNVASKASTDDTTPTLRGTGTVGTVVTVYADGVAVGSTSVASDGSWSVTTSPLGGDGTKSLTAEAVDGAGQSSPRTGIYLIELDTTAPATPAVVTAMDDQGPAQGAIAAGGVTDDTTPTFSGSGVKAGDTIRLYDGSALIGSITVATDGAWSITPSTPLTGGSHRITHTITDAAGNASAASAALEFTVDITDIVVSIDQVADDQGSVKGNLAPGASTDDTTPTLVGKATAGALVTVSEGSTALGSTTADAGGSWRLTLPAQGQGKHSYTATAVNAAGRKGDAAIELTIDTTAPEVPKISGVGDDVGLVQGALANGASSDDTTPTLAGSGATAGDLIKVYDNGSYLGSATVRADGSWSFTPTTPLAEGAHRLTTTATDPVGNESAHSGSFTVNVDVTAPTSNATLGAISTDTGTSASDFVTSDRTLVATITLDSALEQGATVQVSLDNGRSWNNATPVGGSNYQFDNTAASLPDGSHTFLARVVDAAGNATQPSSQVVIVDNSGPTADNAVAITAYADDVAPNVGDYGSGTSTNDTTPVLKGTVAGLKAGDVVQVFEGSALLGTAAVNGSEWTFALPTLASGSSHTYKAVIADAAGNKGTASADFSLSVVTGAPSLSLQIVSFTDDQAPLTGTFASGSSTNDTAPLLNGTFAGTLNPGDSVVVYRDGVRLGAATMTGGSAWSFQDTGLADGNSYSYVALVEDAAGNRGGASAAFTLGIDQRAPTAAPSIEGAFDDIEPVTGSIAPGGATNDARAELKGAGAEANGTVNVYDNGTLIASVVADAAGKWSYTPAAGKALAEGAHSLAASSVDAAGNEGPRSAPIAFTVDTVAPAAAPSIDSAIDDVAPVTGSVVPGGTINDARPELKGSGAEANGIVRIYDSGTLIGSTTADGAGKWSFTPEAGKELADGSHSLAASSIDAAGNEGPRSAALAFTVDTVAPTQSTAIVSVNDDQGALQGTVADGGFTDDAAPQVAGTVSAPLQAGETVVVLRDGAVIGTAKMTDSRHWTFDDAGLGDGRTYTYTARVEDASGNRGAISGSYAVTVDTSVPAQKATISTVFDNVEPVQGDVANGGTTNDSQPELRGTITASLAGNEFVAVYRDNVKVGTATISGTSWSYTDTSGLANAARYSYTVRVEDAAGNGGALSSPYVITLQLSGPPTTTTITAVTDDVDPQQGSVVHDGYTNDTAPQVSGTISAALQAGEKVAVLRDGKEIGFATMTDATHWTYADSGLANGAAYVYTARVQDAASNVGAESNAHAIRIDTSAPTQTVRLVRAVDNVDPVSGDIPGDGTTNDDTPTLEGTLSVALNGTEQLHVFRNGVDAGIAKVSGTAWTFEDASLSSGTTYTYEAKVMDAAGNASAASNSLRFTVNTSGVAQTVQMLGVNDHTEPVIGNVADGGTTNETRPTLRGSISTALGSGDVVQVLRDDKVVGTATVAGTTWTFRDSGLADGMTYSYTARVVNSGGNEGARSAAYAISLDLTAPRQAVAISSFTDDQDPRQGDFASGSTTNDTTPRLNGTLGASLAAGEAVAIYRNATRVGSATMTGATTWSFQDSGLADGGSYSYTAVVVDAAGNEGPVSAAFSLAIDRTAPAAAPSVESAMDDVDPVKGPIVSGGTTNDPRPVLKGSGAEPNGTVRIYDNGTLIGTATADGEGKWSFRPDAGRQLAEGAHSLTTSNIDAAGNEGPQSTALAFAVDTVAPPVATLGLGNYSDSFPAAGTLAANQSSDRNGNDNTFDLVLTGADASTASYEVSTDGGQSWRSTTAAQSNLPDGKYLFRASLTDAAGNSTAAANGIEVTVDRTSPGLDLQRVSSALVAGTAEAGALVAIDVGNNGSVEASVVADASGNWSWTPTSSIAANTVVSAVAYDLAGNSSSRSTQTADTTPPTVSIDKSDGKRFSGTTSDADAPAVSPTAARPITVTLSVDRNADGVADYVLPFTATVTADGSWSIDASAAPVNVGAIVTAAAQDYSGNRSTPATVTVGGGTSKISGSVSNDNFGYDVQAIGDFNGDGYNDFAVVAPHGSSASRSANKWSVTILYGSKQGLPDLSDVAYLPGTDGLKIYTSGNISDSNILTAVQGYGDVNGDGYSDVIVYDDNLNSDWVIFGRSSTNAGSTPVNVDVRTIISSGGNSDGVAIVQRAGSTWFGAGGALVDVNGDGYADIVMQDWNQGTSRAGTAIIYGHAGAAGSAEWANYYVGFGSTYPSSYVSDSSSSTESYRPHSVIYNDSTNGYPLNVMNIGDINGDGYSDFAYSLYNARNPLTGYGDAGAIQVIYGKGGNFAQDYSLQTDYTNIANGFRVYGEQVDQFLGTYLDPEPYGYLSNTGMPTSSGDVNGDGIADLIIGSPQYGPNAGDQKGPGRVYVVYGKAGGAKSDVNLANFSPSDGFVITASDSTADAMFGNGTSVGDFNGDGIDDIAIGAPLADVQGMINNGAVYIVYGQQGGHSGPVSVAAAYWGDRSANSSSVTYEQNGNINSGSMLGVNVALSDLNGDGQADLALGSPYKSSGLTSNGYLDVVYASAFNFTNPLTVGDDVIAATAGRDRISGGAGNDVITGIGAGDSAYGGAGNDAIHITEIAGVVRVDGGLGIDTLVADASNLTLDLSQLGLKVQGFENFDLGTGAANTGNTLKLRLTDVLSQQSSFGSGNGSGTGQGHLRVTGDSGDTVQLLHGSDSWSVSGSTSVGGVNYSIYHNSNLVPANTLGDIWIQQGITVI